MMSLRTEIHLLILSEVVKNAHNELKARILQSNFYRLALSNFEMNPPAEQEVH